MGRRVERRILRVKCSYSPVGQEHDSESVPKPPAPLGTFLWEVRRSLIVKRATVKARVGNLVRRHLGERHCGKDVSNGLFCISVFASHIFRILFSVSFTSFLFSLLFGLVLHVENKGQVQRRTTFPERGFPEKVRIDQIIR